MRNNFLSRFTPSLMPQEALEDIFVQRERLAARTVQQVRDSALTGPPSHTLFVGPRGIGKTHLVSLIYHRVKALPELGGHLAVAWLPEDEAGIATFLDLLLAILRALGEDDPALTPRLAPRLDALYESASPEEKAKALLYELVGDRPLLLLAENLDHIFAGLRDAGQKALRAFLQESRFVTMVVTAQSLFSGVSRHASPFYGFFRVEHLSGLSIDEAIELLVKIARRESDTDLVQFLGTPAGRARIRAVDHLVSGNPRLYVIFSEFLTRDALDELVPPFLDMLDNLTPFYQAKMRALSPQQRKIVDFLSGTRGAVPVKEIGRRTLIGATTAAAQLKSLRESGYVRAFRVGRESYYELREPLMRLCLEVKKQRGEPIKLFVEFLRLWCPPEELERRLAALPADAAFTRASLHEALRLSALEESPLLAACRRDYARYVKQGDQERAKQVLEEWQALGGPTTLPIQPAKTKLGKVDKWLDNAQELFDQGQFVEALAAYEQCLALNPLNTDAWSNEGTTLFSLGRWEEALAAYEQCLSLDPKHTNALYNKGLTLGYMNRTEEALAALEDYLAFDPQDAGVWYNKGVALGIQGRTSEELAAYDQALALDSQHTGAWFNKAVALDRLDRFQEALSTWEQYLAIASQDASAWAGKGRSLLFLGRFEEALGAWEQCLTLDPQSADIWHKKAIMLFTLDRHEEALEAFNCAISLRPEPPEWHTNRVEVLFMLNRWEEGFAALHDALPLFEDVPEALVRATVNLVRQMFTSDLNQWQARAEALTSAYTMHGRAQALGQALAQSVPALGSPLLSPAARRLWYETWQAQTGDRSEFTLPLRLLDVAVRFLNSGDPPDARILLELPAEERSLLKPLLGVEDREEDDD